MERLRNRQRIVDRAALQEAVEAVFARRLPEAERRMAVLQVYRRALDAGHREIRRRFQAAQDGAIPDPATRFLVEQLNRPSNDTAARHPYTTPTSPIRAAPVPPPQKR